MKRSQKSGLCIFQYHLAKMFTPFSFFHKSYQHRLRIALILPKKPAQAKSTVTSNFCAIFSHQIFLGVIRTFQSAALCPDADAAGGTCENDPLSIASLLQAARMSRCIQVLTPPGTLLHLASVRERLEDKSNNQMRKEVLLAYRRAKKKTCLRCRPNKCPRKFLNTG